MKRLILASASPRRRELLKKAGYPFTVIESNFSEQSFSSDPHETVMAFARGKATEVYERLADENAVVLGADTVVYFDGEILGKPKDEKDAERMLSSLSGNTHIVVTGYCVVAKDRTVTGETVTKVTFNRLDEQKIKEYVASGKPMDKAGAYGIQDGITVESYEGSYDNIVGLPTEEIIKVLKQFMD